MRPALHLRDGVIAGAFNRSPVARFNGDIPASMTVSVSRPSYLGDPDEAAADAVRILETRAARRRDDSLRMRAR